MDYDLGGESGFVLFSSLWLVVVEVFKLGM
jgi:hypothetical protein